jgi:sugar phosphate isomerase/epimerase
MNPLSLAAGVLPECQPEQVADAAAQAGYELAGFTIDPETWSAARTSALRSQISTLGIKVLDVEVIWIPQGGRLDDSHRCIVDVGAELDARNVLVVSREPDVGRNAAALHQLCEWAQPAGMRVALEFLKIAQVSSFSTTHAIVQQCNHPAAAILIDPLHLQRAGDGVAALAAVDPHLFPYAQFCDGNLNCEDSFDAYLEDALDLRSTAGNGELPLRELLRCLPPNCPLSLEVRSKQLREEFPDPKERAAVVRQQTEAFLTNANVT